MNFIEMLRSECFDKDRLSKRGGPATGDLNQKKSSSLRIRSGIRELCARSSVLLLGTGPWLYDCTMQ
jgi:hypothetical protein